MISVYIMLGFIVIIAFLFRQPAVKGKAGEIAVSLCLKFTLRKAEYHVIDNVTIPDDQGGTTQIDHIVVSRHGIFVVETKNMKGWIYGDEKSPQWTQVIFKVKSSFQNPLRQNYKHIMCLAKTLGLPKEAFIHVIVLVGDCTLKNREKLPASVVEGATSMKNFILSVNEQVFSVDQLSKILESIENDRLAPGFVTHRQHVQHVERIIESKEKSVAEEEAEEINRGTMTCPKCGSEMVLRTAKKGKNAGNQFWGCSDYPKCRGIVGL